MQDKKKVDKWDRGYKTAIEHALAVVNRANIDSALKTVLKSKIKKLKTEVEMYEARRPLEKMPPEVI